MPPTRFESGPLEALAPRALFDLMRLRVDVFVVEQRCPYPELDAADIACGTRHVLGRLDGELVACARTLAPEAPAAPSRIGRVAVRADRRGRGIAGELMRWTLATLAREHPERAVVLDAQLAVERFYAALGFERISAEFVEDGIAHVRMRREALPDDARRSPR